MNVANTPIAEVTPEAFVQGITIVGLLKRQIAQSGESHCIARSALLSAAEKFMGRSFADMRTALESIGAWLYRVAEYRDAVMRKEERAERPPAPEFFTRSAQVAADAAIAKMMGRAA